MYRLTTGGRVVIFYVYSCAEVFRRAFGGYIEEYEDEAEEGCGG